MSETAAPPLPQTPEEIRRAHLNHEASVQSIGLLYYLGAVICPIVAGRLLFDGAPMSRQRWLMVALYLVMTLIYFQTGRWLRSLNPKGRLPATLLSVIGLFAFPWGTLINLYILYLLYSKKGKTVFSPDYRAVIDATPHIRYKMSKIVWVAVALVIISILLMLLGVPLRRTG